MNLSDDSEGSEVEPFLGFSPTSSDDNGNNISKNGSSKRFCPQNQLSKADATTDVTVSIKQKRCKRNLKIAGLNLLHSHTVLNIDSEMTGKLQAAPECVQITPITGNVTQEKLEISTGETCFLKLLFELLLFHDKFVKVMDYLQESTQNQTTDLINRHDSLQKQVKTHIESIIALQKLKINRLGIETAQNGLSAQIMPGVELEFHNTYGLLMEDVACCLASASCSQVCGNLKKKSCKKEIRNSNIFYSILKIQNQVVVALIHSLRKTTRKSKILSLISVKNRHMKKANMCSIQPIREY